MNRKAHNWHTADRIRARKLAEHRADPYARPPFRDPTRFDDFGTFQEEMTRPDGSWLVLVGTFLAIAIVLGGIVQMFN